MKVQEQSGQSAYSGGIHSPYDIESKESTIQSEYSMIYAQLPMKTKQTANDNKDEEKCDLVPSVCFDSEESLSKRAQSIPNEIRKVHITFPKSGVMQSNSLSPNAQSGNDDALPPHPLTSTYSKGNATRCIYVKKKVMDQPHNLSLSKHSENEAKENGALTSSRDKPKNVICNNNENFTITFRTGNDSKQARDSSKERRPEDNQCEAPISFQIEGLKRFIQIDKPKEKARTINKITISKTSLRTNSHMKPKSDKRIIDRFKMDELLRSKLQLKPQTANTSLACADNSKATISDESNAQIQALKSKIHRTSSGKTVQSPSQSTPIPTTPKSNLHFKPKHCNTEPSRIKSHSSSSIHNPKAHQRITKAINDDSRRKEQSDASKQDTGKQKLIPAKLQTGEEAFFTKKLVSVYRNKNRPIIKESLKASHYNMPNYYQKEVMNTAINSRNQTEEGEDLERQHTHLLTVPNLNLKDTAMPFHKYLMKSNDRIHNRQGTNSSQGDSPCLTKALFANSLLSLLSFPNAHTPIIIRHDDKAYFNTFNFKQMDGSGYAFVDYSLEPNLYSTVPVQGKMPINQSLISYNYNNYLLNTFTSSDRSHHSFGKLDEYEKKIDNKKEIYKRAFERPDYKSFEKKRGYKANTSIKCLLKQAPSYQTPF